MYRCELCGDEFKTLQGIEGHQTRHLAEMCLGIFVECSRGSECHVGSDYDGDFDFDDDFDDDYSFDDDDDCDSSDYDYEDDDYDSFDYYDDDCGGFDDDDDCFCDESDCCNECRDKPLDDFERLYFKAISLAIDQVKDSLERVDDMICDYLANFGLTNTDSITKILSRLRSIID